MYEIRRYPQHEDEVGELAREMGFTHVSLSSAIMPMARILPRGFTGRFCCNNTVCRVFTFYVNLVMLPDFQTTPAKNVYF